MGRTYEDNDLTNYEKEVKSLCLEIRDVETVEQAIPIFLKHLHDLDKRRKIL